MTFASTMAAPSAWPSLSSRLPQVTARRLALLVAVFVVAMCAEPEPLAAAPPSCPRSFEGPTLELALGCPAPAAGVLYRPEAHADALRLRVEFAAMDDAGNACLDALDGARVERNRCFDLAGARLDGVADLLQAQAEGLDQVARTLAASPAPARQSWVLVGVGGLVAGGAGVAAAAADLSVVETTGMVLGAALVAAGITAAVQWVVGE